MLYRFGEFELDDERCQLRRGPDPVALQPKAFDLLLYLVRARDRVVTKAELLDRLWPDAIVGGHSVVRAVHALRTALGDQRLPRTYVRSVARKGYRFVAELDAETRAAAASDTAGEPERAGALARARVDLYVGREALLQTLRDELARAFAGETRTLVLEGEAGIGKTRTAEEIARLAREQGAQVLTGWCPENEAAAPFQPWLQILGELVATDAWRRIRRTRPGAASDVEGLLRGSSPAPGAEAAPGDARFRLFDAVTAVLRAAAEQAPVLLVVDDLHAADVSSLRLVEFLTRELSDAPLALLVALRTDEVGPQHALVPTLAELARRRRTLRFHLTGLTREEVVRCLAAWAIDPPEPPLLEELIRRCEGNPFFVRELAHWLSDDRGSRASRASVPPSVRDVIRRRLGPRSETCAAILRLAAVIGRDFALDVLLASTPLPRDAALAALDEALSARILEEDPTGSGLRFAHALIQDCLLEEQSSLQRARAHRAIAAALSALDGDGEARLAERAHHACEGADADTAEEAVACALRAGARAMAVTAFEEAARLFGRALDALALSPARSPARRCAIAFDLARAQTHSGDVAGAERSYREAERLAKELGDTRRAARAAIGLLGSLPALAPPAAERIRALEDAAAALGPEDAALRISALSRLGLAWAAAGERARGIRHAETALREARTLGEPLLLAGALALRATVFDPREPPSTRLARVDEALRTLAGAPAPRIELECRIQRAAALLELGHTQAWDAERAAYGALATRLNQRTPRWFVAVQGALRRVMTGDLAAAEREIGEAWAAGRRAGHPDAETYFAIQLTQLRFFQGRLAEMEEPLRRAAASAPSLAGLRAALALVLSETGRLKETRRELDALARDDFSAIPRDAGWLSNLSLLALVAARLRDAEHAAALEERLAAYQDRNVCAFVVASNGSVQHFLGILAAARGGGERALPALERAVAHNAEMGIAPWTALSEQALAEASLLAGGPGSAQRAAGLAERVLEAAGRMGMPPLAAAARQTARLAARALEEDPRSTRSARSRSSATRSDEAPVIRR